MIKDVLQCCYTNASREVGNVVGSGWEAVCVSEGLPSEAYSMCRKIQSANSCINGVMTDENGKILNLLEISGNGTFICMIRTQYGLLDRMKRANMFSHAYVFPCKDNDFVKDPNRLLTIDNGNFKTDEQAAMEKAEDFTRLPAFDIVHAMEKCGLDNKKLGVMVKCVYAQMMDKNIVKPLFIQYDGTEEHMRALLFCIYYCLPFSLRRRLSVASVRTENTVDKNIFFTKSAKGQEYYVVPETGENSVLTDRVDKKLTGLGFLDFAINGVTDPSIQNDLFKRLEENTIELGDPNGTNELLMKIAFIWMRADNKMPEDDKELYLRLNDALRSNSLGNEKMDRYIAMLLKETIKRKLVLTPESEADLKNRVSCSKTTELKKINEEYNFYRFKELPPEEASNYLAKMGDAERAGFVGRLLKEENGKKILDHFYANVMLKTLGNSWEGIEKVINESDVLEDRSETDEKIDLCAWELFQKSLKNVERGDIETVIDDFTSFKGIMEKKYEPDSLKKIDEEAKKSFWEKVSESNINFDMYDKYIIFDNKTERSEFFIRLCEIPRRLVENGDVDDFFARSHEMFTIYKTKLGTNLRERVMGRLAGYALKNGSFLGSDPEMWFKTLTEIENDKVFRSALALYDQCVELERKTFPQTEKDSMDAFGRDIGREAADLRGFFSAFRNYLLNSEEERINSSEIVHIVEKTFAELEKRSDSFSLDVWLKLGSLIYSDEDCFRIFEDVKPRVLSEDESKVVSESELLKKGFRDAAENYVKERGSEFKIVKKWLSELSHAERSADDAKKKFHFGWPGKK